MQEDGCLCGHLTACSLRAQEGCDPNGRDGRGITPLGVAVGFNRLSVVKVGKDGIICRLQVPAVSCSLRGHTATLMPRVEALLRPRCSQAHWASCLCCPPIGVP